MARKKPAAQPTQTETGLVEKAPAGAFRLLCDSVSAKGRKCLAGDVIAPDVEDWPAHRVARHVRQGMAK